MTIKEIEKDMEKLTKKCKQDKVTVISRNYHGFIITVEADHWDQTEKKTT